MKRCMPLLRSRSISSVFVFGSREHAQAEFIAVVDVPTPGLEGRNE